MEAMIKSRQDDALADVYMEAWDRGDAWRNAIIESMHSYDENTQRFLKDSLAKGVARLNGEPKEYELA